MPEELNVRLSKLVNASGFVFQMALEHHLRNTVHEHRWDVIAGEHPWSDAGSNSSGYIDLILSRGAFRLVVECKRPRDGDWVFLMRQGQSLDSDNLRCQWAQVADDGSHRAGCFNFHFPPPSAEAAFCVVRGKGEDDLSLLERLAAPILKAVDCLTLEELALAARRKTSEIIVYLPVIITTARLFICRFDPRTVPLEIGTLPEGEFTAVSCVRFTKSLTAHLSPGTSPRRLDQANLDMHRTVLVISAGSVSDILPRLEITRRHRSDWLPWDEKW